MHKRRFLCFALSLLLVFSMTFGSAYGISLDDLIGEEDLWDEFENLPSVDDVFVSPAPIPGVEDDFSFQEVMAGEGGIMPISLDDNPVVNWVYDITGRSSSGAWTYKSPPSSYTPTSAYTLYAESFYIGYSGSVTSVSLAYDVSYLKENYEKMLLTATFNSYFLFSGSLSGFGKYVNGNTTSEGSMTYSAGSGFNRRLRPDSVQLMVNGKLYGDPVPWGTTNNDISAALSWEILFEDVGESITSLQFILRYDDTFNQSNYTYYFNSGSVSNFSFSPWGIISKNAARQSYSVDFVQGPTEGEVTHGLLNTIISWLKNIVNGITNIATAIAELPGKIAGLILDGIKALFVPDSDSFQELMNNYNTLLETKFGFIYQSYHMVLDLYNAIVGNWSAHTDYAFHFPGISWSAMGEDFTLVAEQDINLDNELMTVLRNFAGTVVSLVCVLVLVHSFQTMFIAVVSGKNYFDYLSMVRGAEQEVEESQ